MLMPRKVRHRKQQRGRMRGASKGATELAFGDYGTIEPGQRARLIAVDIPPGINDVEEYLVSGIQSEQVRWIEE